MRRESSQTSHTSKHGVASPGSGEQPLRHTVKPTARHKGVILPRNHSSARNLQKLNRQPQVQYAADDGRRGARQKSHEGDTEIRLPGSLDESRPPPMRRNLTASQLPRNLSHSKLKKNLSHGQLTRLGSGKNLTALNAKGPPSPGLKGRKKRPKSEDFGTIEKDLHEQEVELARQQAERKESATKKVGFAVGSEGDSDEDIPEEMEGSGLPEDEWTDQSASASPFSTRQNTANNSRRTSMILDKPPDRHSPLSAVTNIGAQGQPAPSGLASISDSNLKQSESSSKQDQSDDEDEDEDEDEDDDDDEDEEEEDDPPSPKSMPQVLKRSEVPVEISTQPLPAVRVAQKSPLHGAKEYPSPATQRILSRNAHHPAPALVSNVSAMDVAHSTRPSPAPSLRSSRSNIGEGSLEQDPDELVSRFIPSASHPTSGSGRNTAVNTPKTSAFHTPENDSTLAQQRGKHRAHYQLGATSPGSTISGSSGATTPAIDRSRTELKMLNEKTKADLEDAARLNPPVPSHVFDRRNVSLKWGNTENGTLPVAPMRPELFQGRFKAVNTELKVVQRFRDPIGESVGRLLTCKGASFTKLRSKKASVQQEAQEPQDLAQVAIIRSAGRQPKPSNLSTSASPPKSASPAKTAMASSRSSTQLARRGESQRGHVTFSQAAPEVGEAAERDIGAGADAIAKQMWKGVL